MTIGMLDAADSRMLLPGWAAYASYVDGGIGDQPNATVVAVRFPLALHLTIALSAEHDADALDVEPLAASVSDIQGWVTRQHVRGIVRPVIYASVGRMDAQILPLVRGWLPGSVRLWPAHYGLGEHICGPGTCGQLSVGADGTQWTATFQGIGGQVDASLLRDDFFGSTPSTGSTDAEKILMKLPAVNQGATGEVVRTVQSLCIARHQGALLGTSGDKKDGVDGVFGDATKKAVTAVQKAAGIAPDGVVGELTWPKLFGI